MTLKFEEGESEKESLQKSFGRTVRVRLFVPSYFAQRPAYGTRTVRTYALSIHSHSYISFISCCIEFIACELIVSDMTVVYLMRL